jgi:predicted lipoprotein with Yx(FWY)xxD motif
VTKMSIVCRMAAASAASLAGAALFPAAASGSPSSGRAEVAIESSPAGKVLVVGGNGAGFAPGSTKAAYPAGSSLYIASVDPPVSTSQQRHGYVAGCNATTKAVSALEEQGSGQTGPNLAPTTCAGSETDQYADWPALTTRGAPIAGHGVDKNLLGTVYRADLHANQVTYGGHPLYLFDPGPNSFAGENFVETVSPLFPWHTLWYLVTPGGRPDPGPAKLASESPQSGTSYTADVLALQVLPALGGIPDTVYSFSRDTSHQSNCTGSCARRFIPVLTAGSPTAPGLGGRLGTLVRSDGTRQVTWDGHPLYTYSHEQPLVSSTNPSQAQTAGNGNGGNAFGGTFRLVKL